MQIREFETTDLDDCAALFASVFNGEPWNESWRFEDARMRIGDIAAAPKFIGLVMSNRELLGFVVGNVIRIESDNIFELKEMCVRTEKQRLGLGTQLLNELKRRLPEFGVDSIFLQTSHEKPAFQFYLKNGFCRESSFSALVLSPLG